MREVELISYPKEPLLRIMRFEPETEVLRASGLTLEVLRLYDARHLTGANASVQRRIR